MTIETDLGLPDGRTLHVYDEGGADRLAVFWHHGTPNIGAPPVPLIPAAERLGIRWVSHDRPGYGGSTPHPGRSVSSVAADVAQVADSLGIERFAVVGHSGGGPHALACGALLPDRVLAVVSISGPAPFDAEGLDWFAGMAPAGATEARAAAQGRETREALARSDEVEADLGFTPADEAALTGDWAWLLDVVRPAIAAGYDGMIDDSMAAVQPWGFDPAEVVAPVLILHGQADRMVPVAHAEWLARHCPDAGHRLRPGLGHITVLNEAESALAWLREQADGGGTRSHHDAREVCG